MRVPVPIQVLRQMQVQPTDVGTSVHTSAVGGPNLWLAGSLPPAGVGGLLDPRRYRP